MVVAVTTTLDTAFGNNRISPLSIQGQFTTRYFDTPEKFSESISTVVQQTKQILNETEYSELPDGSTQFFPGEVFKIRSPDRVGYLVAFASFNAHGTAQLTNEEFKDALPKMWLGLKERGDIGTIDLPLIGSGFSRLDMKRNDILSEIIRSYVAACTEGRIADRVEIYIRPSDYEKWEFDLSSIENALQFICEQHSSLLLNRANSGTALSA